MGALDALMGPLSTRELALLALLAVLSFSYVSYFLGNALVALMPKQDLKKKVKLF